MHVMSPALSMEYVTLSILEILHYIDLITNKNDCVLSL